MVVNMFLFSKILVYLFDSHGNYTCTSEVLTKIISRYSIYLIFVDKLALDLNFCKKCYIFLKSYLIVLSELFINYL